MRIGTVVSLSLLAMSAEPAVGGGFSLYNQNASGTGNAFAGSAAATEDASTIFYNPAGLTRITGRQVVLAGHAVLPSFKFDNTGSTLAATQTRLGGDGGDAGDLAGMPNAYFAWAVSPNVVAGVGLGSHFGLKTEYDSNWVGRFHAIKSELRAPTINPSIAFKVNEMVSLGFGVSYQRVDAELTNAVNYSGAVAQAAPALINAGACPSVAACIAGLAGANGEGRAKVQGDDESWGWNVGVLFNLNRDTQLGIAYRAAIKHNIKGDVDFDNRPPAFAAVPALAAAVADSDIKTRIKLPAIASLGIAHMVSPSWQVLASVDWTQWSTIKQLTIDRSNGTALSTLDLQWKDTWRVGAGVNYLRGPWKFRFGVAYDESPVTGNLRTPRLPDSDRWWVGLGVQYVWKENNKEKIALDVGYLHEFLRDSDSKLTSVANGNLIGNYDSKVDVLSAQVRVNF